EKLLQEVVKEAREAGRPENLNAQRILAQLLHGRGRTERACSILERLLRGHRSRGRAAVDPEHAACLHDLGQMYRASGRLGEARKVLRDALIERGRTSGRTSPHYALTLGELASVEWCVGNTGGARMLFAQSAAVYRSHLVAAFSTLDDRNRRALLDRFGYS